jgi:hypothetical protein
MIKISKAHSYVQRAAGWCNAVKEFLNSLRSGKAESEEISSSCEYVLTVDPRDQVAVLQGLQRVGSNVEPIRVVPRW